MWFMNWIVSQLNSVSDDLYELYLDCYYAGWPLSLISTWFYYLSSTFSDLAWYFSDFGDWVNQVAVKIADLLDWTTVWSNIVSIIPNLEDLRDWFYHWWLEVWTVVDSWWSTTSVTVQGWIAASAQDIDILINQVEASLIDLRASWDGFWTITWPGMLSDLGGLRSAWENFLTETLPNLATWTGVGDLVESTLRSWFPFYDALVALWGDLEEFIVNPLDWLANHIESWFWEV